MTGKQLYDLRVIVHSRVSDLRRDGHMIERRRDGDIYLYRLVGSLTEATSPALGAATPGAGVASVSALDAGHPTHPTTETPSSAQGWPASNAPNDRPESRSGHSALDRTAAPVTETRKDHGHRNASVAVLSSAPDHPNQLVIRWAA